MNKIVRVLRTLIPIHSSEIDNGLAAFRQMSAESADEIERLEAELSLLRKDYRILKKELKKEKARRIP